MACSYDLGKIELSDSSVDDKGATIIACGLKLSTEIIVLYLCKLSPTDYNNRRDEHKSVDNNSIGPEGAKALGEALKGHPSLQSLLLGSILSSLSGTVRITCAIGTARMASSFIIGFRNKQSLNR